MISFSKILQRVLNERMSFRDLYANSDPARVDRSHDVNVRSLAVTSMGDNEAWTFSYKSNPSTTGQRWKGYVRFLKESVSNKDRADELDCMVDCTCPDYRFRFAYNNAQQDAGALGPGAWNGNNGQAPRPTSQGGVGDHGPGLCKHLLALGEYLKTKIEPEAPEPQEPVQTPPPAPKPSAQAPQAPQAKPTQPAKPAKPAIPTKKPTILPKPTINAPEPDDTYSDSRSELQEGTGTVAKKLDLLIQSEPQFEVNYHDEA